MKASANLILKAYKVYDQDANLLEGIGEAELTDEKIKLAEAFIGKLYNQVTDTSGCSKSKKTSVSVADTAIVRQLDTFLQ
jgi:hypothetical protein